MIWNKSTLGVQERALFFLTLRYISSASDANRGQREERLPACKRALQSTDPMMGIKMCHMWFVLSKKLMN